MKRLSLPKSLRAKVAIFVALISVAVLAVWWALHPFTSGTVVQLSDPLTHSDVGPASGFIDKLRMKILTFRQKLFAVPPQVELEARSLSFPDAVTMNGLLGAPTITADGIHAWVLTAEEVEILQRRVVNTSEVRRDSYPLVRTINGKQAQTYNDPVTSVKLPGNKYDNVMGAVFDLTPQLIDEGCVRLDAVFVETGLAGYEPDSSQVPVLSFHGAAFRAYLKPGATVVVGGTFRLQGSRKDKLLPGAGVTNQLFLITPTVPVPSK